MRRSLDGLSDGIEMVKPALGQPFIPHTTPDPLLRIQGRLIARQARQSRLAVRPQEPLPLLPAHSGLPGCPWPGRSALHVWRRDASALRSESPHIESAMEGHICHFI